MDILHVDCRTCRARGPACDDCVISVLLGPAEAAVSLDSQEQQALQAMAASGLLPPLRVVPALRIPSPPGRDRRSGPTGFARARAVP